jgi:hypothetical protein
MGPMAMKLRIVFSLFSAAVYHSIRDAIADETKAQTATNHIGEG